MPPASSIKSDTQTHLISGASQHVNTVRAAIRDHAQTRRANGNDSAPRPATSVNFTSQSRIANRLGQSWLPFSSAGDRSSRQSYCSKPIEVIVTQPNECDEGERGPARSDREHEPFISEEPCTGDVGDGDGRENSTVGGDIHKNGVGGQAQRRCLFSGRVNCGVNERCSTDTGLDKVWI